MKHSLSTIQETSNTLIEKIKSNLTLEKEISIADKIKEAKEKANIQPINEKQEKQKSKDISL